MNVKTRYFMAVTLVAVTVYMIFLDSKLEQNPGLMATETKFSLLLLVGLLGGLCFVWKVTRPMERSPKTTSRLVRFTLLVMTLITLGALQFSQIMSVDTFKLGGIVLVWLVFLALCVFPDYIVAAFSLPAEDWSKLTPPAPSSDDTTPVDDSNTLSILQGK